MKRPRKSTGSSSGLIAGLARSTATACGRWPPTSDSKASTLLPNFAGFLLDGLLTREIAVLRMRYADPAAISGRLDDLVEKEVVEDRSGKLHAAPSLRPLLKALESAIADVAFGIWAGNEVAVSVATESALEMRNAITPDHVVAEAHAKVREPIDRYKMLHQRLTTLRYIRQHDHAAAWIERNLTAKEMPAMTALWRGEEFEIHSEVLDALREGSNVKKSDPPTLTSKGRKVREAIEDDTNTRSQKAFDVLGEEQARRFLAALKRLPG